MSCGVGCRRVPDLALLWLWRRPAVIAPRRPLAWETKQAWGAALERQKKKKKRERERERKKKSINKEEFFKGMKYSLC